LHFIYNSVNNSVNNHSIKAFIMARFWSSSTVTSAPAAPATASASSNAGGAKHGSRLVRQTDESDENYTSYLSSPPLPRTPEQKANRPLRPRSASRDAANAGNNSSNNNNNSSFHSGGSNLFAGEYYNSGPGTAAVAGGEDTYDWPEQIQFYAQQGGQGEGSGSDALQQPSDTQQQQPPPPRRSRMNSRDIPRSYSGLYGFSDGDLLPFELNRHRDTFGTETNTAWFLGVYLTLLTTVQLLSLTIMSDMRSTWTVTNAIHLMITLVYVHWLKGSLYDEQGEMNALTVWEQLEATQGTKPVRQVLLIVPTVLTWAACWAAQYDTSTSILNIVLWLIAIAAKLPFMNGVRIFGINRTAGIDDNDYTEPRTGTSGGTGAGNGSSATTASTSNVSGDKKNE
jgi:hypothetical protein